MKTTVEKFKFIAKIARNVACLTAFFALSASAAPVAKVGETECDTLKMAFAALSSENYTLTLQDTAAWPAETPVHWAAGTQSGFATTLAAALTAGYKANEGAITIVCRPGADVGTMTHGHVEDNLTIYGNNAYLSGGECDLEVDTYRYSRATGALVSEGAFLTQDIAITAYELDNLGVWGQRHTSYTVTVTLTDCDGKALEGTENVQRVYISGTTGRNDITLTGCDFLTKDTAVYSNADGTITATDCTFTGGAAPFNINHKANGAVSVNVTNCSFKNCGDAGEWKQFAAPVRLVNSGAGTMVAAVTKCAFAETVGANGDILLGDGRTGQKSNDVTLKVAETTAGIQAQKPGYYDGETTNAAKGTTTTTTTADTLETSVETLLPVDPRTLGYATSGTAAALPAAPDMSGAVVNVTAAQAQYVLDGAYGSIDGKTINFTESVADTLVIGRASKYEGSGTLYRHGSHDGEAMSYADFIAYKNQTTTWTEGCYYERALANVTFTANAGVIVNFTAEGGAHVYGTESAPVYDYVRDTGTWTFDTNNGFFKRAILKNITFKGLTFTAKTDFNTSESTTVFDGFTFTGCTFEIGSTAAGNYALRYYDEYNNGNVRNLVVENCTFKNCYQGVYTHHVKGITVKDCAFDTTGHNAIAIQSQGGEKGACDHGAVVITGNTFKNIGDRIIRFNMVGSGTTITIADNTADGNSGKLDSATGKREIVAAVSLPENVAEMISASNNDWGANAVAEGAFADAKLVAATIGTVLYETLDAAIAAVKDGETVVVNAGEYKLNGSLSYKGKAFTIKAAEGAKVSFDMSAAIALHDAKITFEGVTFDYKTNKDYTGLQHADTLVYNDCTINGKVFLYATSETFNRCVFNQSAVDYNVWTYGAKKVAFNACTFNCAGKSVFVYNEGNGATQKTDLTVTACEFKASAGVTGKAAIEIDTSLMKGDTSVTIDDQTTATGFATGSNSGSTLWNDKKQTKDTNKNVTVTVAGKTVFAPAVAKIGEAGYSSLAEAIAEAKDGEVIDLLANTTLSGYVLDKGVTIRSAGETRYEIKGLKAIAGSGVALENVFLNLDQTLDIGGTDTTLKNCVMRAKDVGYWDIFDGITTGFTGGKAYQDGAYTYLVRVSGTRVSLTDCRIDGTDKEESYFPNMCLAPVSGTDVTMTRCTFNEGYAACYYSTPSGTWTLEDCTFTKIYCYNIQAGDTAAKIVVKGCSLAGWTSFGSSMAEVSFENCAFAKSSGYATIVAYKNATFSGCTFTEDYKDNLFVEADTAVDLNACSVVDGDGQPSATVSLAEIVKLDEATAFAALDATKDADGKYTAGTFVGSKDTIRAAIAEGRALKTDADGFHSLVEAVAQIGSVGYITLAEALAAAKDGETVTLLADVNGDGIVVPANAFPTGLVVDFAGHTYTVGGLLVGSSTTKSNGFQLLAGNKITFKNGSLVGAMATAGEGTDWTGAPAILIQNYCDLTLEKMTVKGGDETCYTLSNNNGDIVIADSTIVAGKGTRQGPFAFDVCRYSSYPSVRVTVKGDSVIDGNVEVSGTIGEGQSRQLDIEGGTFKGTFSVANQPANIAISGGTFSTAVPPEYCAAGFIPAANGDGTYGVKEGAFVAEIGTAKYETLEAALAAAKDGETVKMLADVTEDVTVATSVTLDLGGKTLTNAGAGKVTLTIAEGKTVTVKNGSIVGGASNYTIQNNGTATFEDVTATAGNVGSSMLDNFGTLTINSGTYVGGMNTVKNEPKATLTINGGTFENSYGENNNHTGVIYNAGSVEILGGELRNKATSPAWAYPHVVMTVWDEVNKPSTVVKGGTFTCDWTSWKASILSDAGSGAAGCTTVSGGTFNKKVPENYCAAGFIPAANGDGTYGVKEGAYVAEIGTAKYETLEAALAAAKDGETVKMLADVELAAAQTISQKLVLDLNGKSIRSAVDKFLVIEKGGDLTVDDATNEGRIENTAAEFWARVLEMKGGVLTVNGGTIAANKATSSLSTTIIVATGSSSKIDLAGGRIEAVRTANHAQGVIELGTYVNATLNVTGGEIVGSGTGIRSLAGNAVNVSGGTIVGQTGNAVYSSKASVLTITGGLFESQGASIAFGMGTGNSAVTIGREGGSATDVIIPSMDFDGRVVTVNLLSGTVKEFRKWTEMTVENVSQGAATLLVGTDISTKLPGSDLLCQKDAASGLYEVVKMTVENAAATVLHDGVETSYNTVEQAQQAVVDGDTLTLKVDYPGSLAFTAQNVTIDLGGKTLTGASDSHALSFNQSATADNSVTVKNGTIVAKGLDAACIRATSGDVVKTLTVVLGDGLTLTASSNNRSGRVVLDKGARTAAPCADVNNGGLLVTEDGKDWIYGETETAFTHANGTEVTLQNDWYSGDYGGTVKVPDTAAFASAKLNLGGHTVKAYGYGGVAIVMGNDAKPAEGTAVKSLEISNGEILTSSHGAAVCGSNKTLVFDNVKLTTTGDSKLGLYVNGMTSGNAVTLKNGSALTAEKGTGIYFPGAGTLTVVDSAVTGTKSGIEIRAGVLNVSGTSAIASTATAFSFKNNDNGITTTGAAVAAVKHTVGNDLTVNISGGTFKGPRGFYANDPNPTTGGKVTVAISGGTFSTEPEAAYVAAGCKVTRQTGEDGAALYVVGPAVTTIAVTLDGAARALPFPDAWLAANIGAAADGWTPEALAASAANGLAKWQCYLFGLSTTDKAAAIVATAGQGTATAIPLTVWNADASASPLVADGYVTVAYRLMGSDDGAAWTPVGDEATKADGLAIPLETKTYKFYRADVIVTPAE